MGASTPQQETVHYMSSADFSFILIHWIQQMWPSRETFFFFFFWRVSLHVETRKSILFNTRLKYEWNNIYSFLWLKHMQQINAEANVHTTWLNSSRCFTALAISSWFFSSHFFFLSFCQKKGRKDRFFLSVRLMNAWDLFFTLQIILLYLQTGSQCASK